MIPGIARMIARGSSKTPFCLPRKQGS
jgi:hypothetical protein